MNSAKVFPGMCDFIRPRRGMAAAVLPLAALALGWIWTALPPRIDAAVTIVRTVGLDGTNGDYPSLDDHYFNRRSFGGIDIAPNGTVGMIHRDITGDTYLKDVQMILHEYDVLGTRNSQAVNSFQSSDPGREPLASVAYDSNSRPHVVYCSRAGNMFYYTRNDGTGAWIEAPLEFDLASWLGGRPATRYSMFRLVRGLDGNVHLLFSAYPGTGAYHLFQATLTANGWYVRDHGDYRALLTDGEFAFDELFAFQVDASGRLHVCYSTSEPYGDPENLPRERLNWARSAGSGWTREVLRQGTSVDDRPAWNAHMALDRNGDPRALSLHTTHAVTGSMQTAKLYYYKRTGTNTWTRELIADSADGYTGGDGNKYTGEYPHLVFDDSNRPHVIFADIASWHWECVPGNSCNDQIRGQMRYAWKSGLTWNKMTLYEQDGQSASPNPLHLFESPDLVVSPGGSRIYAYGMDHRHLSTTYAYDQEAFKTYRVIFVEAQNTAGSDPSATLQAILLRILGYPIPPESLDRNSDSAIDIGDAVTFINE